MCVCAGLRCVAIVVRSVSIQVQKFTTQIHHRREKVVRISANIVSLGSNIDCAFEENFVPFPFVILFVWTCRDAVVGKFARKYFFFESSTGIFFCWKDMCCRQLFLSDW